MHRSVVEDDMARRRALLDSERQQQYDVQKKIAEYQLTLDALTKEQLACFGTRDRRGTRKRPNSVGQRGRRQCHSPPPERWPGLGGSLR